MNKNATTVGMFVIGIFWLLAMDILMFFQGIDQPGLPNHQIMSGLIFIVTIILAVLGSIPARRLLQETNEASVVSRKNEVY